mgnify:CR=1 FL=1
MSVLAFFLTFEYFEITSHFSLHVVNFGRVSVFKRSATSYSDDLMREKFRFGGSFSNFEANI